MKRIYIFLFTLIACQFAFAQNSEEQEVFRQNILSQYNMYFEKAEYTKEGSLYLDAKETYFSMTPEKKVTIMEIVLNKWNENLVIVRYQYKRELWKKDLANSIKLLDNWDMNSPYLQQPKDSTSLQTANVHPWFFYLGGNGNFNSDYGSLYFNTRIGCYLLNNVWDMAATYTAGISGNSGSTATSSLGLMSKVYYPLTIKEKYRFSPYVGLGITYNYQLTSNDYSDDDIKSTSWTVPVYLGTSWFVGPGSLDIGFQIGDGFITTIGYTFSLSKKK